MAKMQATLPIAQWRPGLTASPLRRPVIWSLRVVCNPLAILSQSCTPAALNGKRRKATRLYRFISAPPRACLIAGAGDDLLSGGAGFDRFIGGEGRDVFFFDAEGAAWRETIVDFNAAEDRLAFQLEGLSVMEALSLSREETNFILNYGLGSIVLSGQAEADLTEDHFLFV